MMKKRTLPSDADCSGRNLGAAEIQNLKQVLDSGVLNCIKGSWVKTFEQQFGVRYHSPFVRCTTSGTAAMHTAIAAIDPEPGDEIITTPITDMGAITPIIYQAAIPIFADVDPLTLNVTAETIAHKIGPRTRAIIATHLFGNPCDMGPILKLAKDKGIPVIEDSAQSYLAEYKGRLVGTLGTIGCFSLQQSKHMTTGEGGIVVTANPDLARRMSLFVDKAWGYGDENPDHYFLALNYRMTELQGAVALAQLEKVDQVVKARREKAALLTALLSQIEGVTPLKTTEGSKAVYWKYCLLIDGEVDAFAGRLKEEYGIFSLPRYIKKPAFQCQVLKEKKTFGKSGFPFVGPHRKGLSPIEYKEEDYPGTFQALKSILVLPWNENYTKEDVHFIAEAVMETASRTLC